MLLEISPLWDFFSAHKNNQQPLVLATIVKTTGSTYKKQGAMMLINEVLKTCGLLSGGCLEADIAEHAESVFSDGVAKLLEYDLSDDAMFSLGAGCEGSIWVLLQLLNPQQSYQPFQSLDPSQSMTADLFIQYRGETDCLGHYVLQGEKHNGSTGAATQQLLQEQVEMFSQIRIKPPPSVCIAGAGEDANPVYNMMRHMYWHGTIMDHRIGLLERMEVSGCWHTHPVRFHDQVLQIQNDHYYDAAVIMSHNIERDAAYLRYFYAKGTAYIGLLGPMQRRDKVLQKAGFTLQQLQGRLSAPMGLPLGGRLPEHIALSVTADIQQHFNKAL
ncbi:XdhC family protein [Marinicella sp. W31]|uniref:XdhC family protein n=1 Tax=Marinicella sp. W31 TaxID=3023713 RepID=UPI0037582CD7